MDWSILICLIFLDCCRGRNVARTYPDTEVSEYPQYLAENSFDRKIEKILRLIKRRYSIRNNIGPFLPKFPEDLPEAEPIHPGHTLLRPALGMLKSAVKFPEKDSGKAAVYGNLENLGITYGKTPYRIRYTDFRKHNDLLGPILNAVEIVDKRKGKEKGPSVVIIEPASEASSSSREYPNYRALKVLSTHGEMISEEENNADEILDEDNDEDSEENSENYRRHRSGKDKRDANVGQNGKSAERSGSSRKKSRYRKRSNEESSLENSNCTGSTSSSSSSESSEYEKNEGNPYTVFNDKYKQNWLWNHFMDGDHMNINPYGPQFNSLGPSGADLIFGRKWWYFNQDDFKPFR